MPESELDSKARAFRTAFAAQERQARVGTGKVAALLVAGLMPFGSTLDLAVYPERFGFFLALRLSCAAVALVIWFLLTQPFGQRHHRLLGLLTAWLPAFFITWMIYDREGPVSPYYAGLNLIILAISLVVRWKALESLVAVGGVILMYLAACVLYGQAGELGGLFVSNVIFMLETGVIVVVGNHFFNRLRFHEFLSRYELDERTRELEETLRKLREAEAHLLQQEKMASLGVMSAGIIHEINNPLNFAATSLFALRKKAKHLPPDQQADYQAALAEIEEGVNRVKNIVSDLRLFTHPNAESPEDVDVAEALNTAARLLAGELGSAVHFERNLSPGLTVRANRNKLVHVLVNLLQNSLDALRRKSFDTQPPTIRVEGRAEDGRVLLTVWDNGPGIRPEDQPRVFDPFFTTKDVGEGMGLGLSICYRLMREFHGDIRLDSEPGRYCRFTLELPGTSAVSKPSPP